MDYPKISKSEMGVAKQVGFLGESFSNARMIAVDLNLKVKTVKKHLRNLESKKILKSAESDSDKGVMLYSLTEDAIFFGWVN